MRKARIDLNLTQKYVAEEIFKTSVQNIRNWEANRSHISLQFRPALIEFIGYCPCDVSFPIGLKLKERRENFGLSVKTLSDLLKVDPCTIAAWERNSHHPTQKSLAIIEAFFKSAFPDAIARPQLPPRANNAKLALSSSFPNYILYEQNWTVGQKITAWRLSAGLPQRKLAKLSGLCVQSICRWEKGRRIPNTVHQNQLLKTVVLYIDSIMTVE